jgi:quercetin dioxygenase-like cupin family protein
MTSETLTKPYRIAAKEGLANVWWKTGRVAVKTSGAETGGRFSQVEVDDPLGTAPPLHIHHQEDETFYVLEGEITVFADAERIEASAGDFAFVPSGVPHAYLVRSERARMLVTFSPAGFEEFFVEMGVPVNGGGPPAEAVLPPPRSSPDGSPPTGARSRARRPNSPTYNAHRATARTDSEGERLS